MAPSSRPGPGHHGDILSGKSFFVSRFVPSRNDRIAKIKELGGRVVKAEGVADYVIVDPSRQDLLSDGIGYTFIDTVVREGALPNISDYVVSKSERDVGSASNPAKNTRTPFTLSEDGALWKFVERKKQGGCAVVNGLEIYKKFAIDHPQHTAQSWRERYKKHLIDNPPLLKTRAEKRKTAKNDPYRGWDREFEHLMAQASDIVRIDLSMTDEAWAAWAKAEKSTPHSKEEWKKFWETKVYPEYMRRKRARARSKSRQSSSKAAGGRLASSNANQANSGTEDITVANASAKDIEVVEILDDANAMDVVLPVGPNDKPDNTPISDNLAIAPSEAPNALGISVRPRGSPTLSDPEPLNSDQDTTAAAPVDMPDSPLFCSTLDPNAAAPPSEVSMGKPQSPLFLHTDRHEAATNRAPSAQAILFLSPLGEDIPYPDDWEKFNEVDVTIPDPDDGFELSDATSTRIRTLSPAVDSEDEVWAPSTRRKRRKLGRSTAPEPSSVISIGVTPDLTTPTRTNGLHKAVDKQDDVVMLDDTPTQDRRGSSHSFMQSIDLLPASRLQSQPPDLGVEETSNEDIDAFIHRMATDHEIVDQELILMALKRTSIRLDLATIVLLEIKAGRGMPLTIGGIWTEDEDDALLSGKFARYRQLAEKHGDAECIRRQEFLKSYNSA
ncbi:hypothetical protein K470DRAFT_259428 [Piedraia hortae CBS 480.64]|uniref:DNA-binding protein RAP1 n=1 Tax=Piedraia hortae CBS 480.64 TaxID=1314780 RepID=A0A6A7BUK4_9PEZI|nr:hypothetical protein K470DRAFT_259428 [Piedraia hortae CBS 480.64]